MKPVVKNYCKKVGKRFENTEKSTANKIFRSKLSRSADFYLNAGSLWV